MKKTFIILSLLLTVTFCISQNVGIGTASPTSKLHIVGTTRSTGNLSTDADFSVSGNAAIGGGVDPAYKLRVIGGDARIGGEFHATGNVGIGSLPDANYKLRVYGGTSRFDAHLEVIGQMAIGGDIDPQYKLRVYGGDARIGGEFHATGNVGIGNTPDANYKLRVYGGNSRFDGNANVTGNLDAGSVDVAGALTIGGKGSVKSNGTSPLRIGFDQKSVNFFLANNDDGFVYTDITDFAGGNNDVRVLVSHFESDIAGSVPWSKIGITVTGVDAANDRCLLWFHNRSGVSGMVVGTVYLMTVAKN